MDDRELDELERLEREATPGPWVSLIEGRDHLAGDDFIQAPGDRDPDIYVSIRVNDSFHPAAAADQDFIAAARNAMPGLIAEIRRLRAGH
jgi:hypothetical protein